MKTQNQTKDIIQIIAGALSLVALLSYTLVHTGGLLSSYVNPGVIGYVAAFGIELSIVGLSLRIGDLRKSGQDVKFFVGVLVAVVSVSAMANIAEGFKVNQGVNLTFESAQRLDIVQAVIGLAATGLISLIVFALSEIVGTDVNVAVKLAEKATKVDKPQVSSVQSDKPSVQPTLTPEVSTFDIDTLLGAFGVKRDEALQLIEQYNLTPDKAYTYLRDKLPAGLTKGEFVRLFNELTDKVTLDTQPDKGTVKVDSDVQTKQTALDTIVKALTVNPDTSVAELSRLVGKSRQTVYTYLTELETSGRLRRNGHAEVITADGQ